MQQALSLFLDQAGKGGNGQGQGTQQGSVLIPSQLQQRTGNRKTMTGSHPQLHNPHPAEPSSPSQGRNPVCGRNLLVAPDIALLGRGPPHSLTQAQRNKSDHSHGAVTQRSSGCGRQSSPCPCPHRPRHSLDTSWRCLQTQRRHTTQRHGSIDTEKQTWRHIQTCTQTHPYSHRNTLIHTHGDTPRHRHAYSPIDTDTYMERHQQTRNTRDTDRHRNKWHKHRLTDMHMSQMTSGGGHECHKKMTGLEDLLGTGKAGNIHSRTLHIRRHPQTRVIWRVIQR